MKLGINLAALDKFEHFKELPGLCHSLGIEYIELPIHLWQQREGKREDIHPLKVMGFNNLLHRTPIFPLPILCDEVSFKIQFEQMDKKFEHCESLCCNSISLGIDPWSSFSREKAETLFIDRVRLSALKARRKNLKLMLEYISPKIARNNGDSEPYLFCASLMEAIQLIKKIDLENVKLLLDFIHWYCDDEKPPLASFYDHIGFVHICDHPEIRPDHIQDLNRRLPFEGKLPLKDFMKNLKDLGYSGFVSVEIFKNDFYSPTFLDIRNSLKKVNEVLCA